MVETYQTHLDLCCGYFVVVRTDKRPLWFFGAQWKLLGQDLNPLPFLGRIISH